MGQSCALFLVRRNELHTGLLRSLLSRQLPLMEPVDHILDRQDGVVKTASSRRSADTFTFYSG